MTFGLVDAHVHITSPEGAAQLAASGIVAARDAGMRANRDGALYQHKDYPSIVRSGWAIVAEGGYGERFGIAVSGHGAIRQEIKRLKAAGAGIIKTMASGMVSLREPGRITTGGFGADDLSFLVHEAADRGLGVMCHANGEDAILAAVAAGVRSIEHGFFMTERALDAMAVAGVSWVPTIGALARAAEQSLMSDSMRQYVARLIDHHRAMLLKAYLMGLSLAIGTDCTLPHPNYRAAYDDEMRYFEQSGIPNDAVLRIATESGAELPGRQ